MTRYTMRLDVRAWQVAPDGSLPDEGYAALRRVTATARGASLSGGPAWYVPIAQAPIRDFRYWQFRSGHEEHRAIPGDWIVQTRYGLEAMSDEQFRERCTEVAGAS